MILQVQSYLCVPEQPIGMFQWPESGKVKASTVSLREQLRTLMSSDLRSLETYSKTCSPASTLSWQKTMFSKGQLPVSLWLWSLSRKRAELPKRPRVSTLLPAKLQT